MMKKNIINSHNGWDPLEEVVIGVPFDLDYSNDTSFRLFFHDNIGKEVYFEDESGTWKTFGGKPSNKIRDEALEDIEGITSSLSKEGIIVRRPEVIKEVKITKSPWWEAPFGHAMMSRDIFIVINDEIIETPPMVRSRYFEADLYKKLFTEYMVKGARYTSAPRSQMREENFDFSYAIERGYTEIAPIKKNYEAMFDGAQILRLGKDLIFNCSTENHRLGKIWLENHLQGKYRVHEINIADNHIDAKLVALRPGLILVHRGLDLRLLPDFLQSWDKIWYDPIELTHSGNREALALASESIGMNLISLSPDKVMLQEEQLPLIKSLKQHGIEAIPVSWRHGQLLGGGLHCMSLDIRRDGVLEDYFK